MRRRSSSSAAASPSAVPPARATIDPPDENGVPSGPAIRALHAHELVLEDITLTGGLNGLDAIGSRQLRLTGVRAIANPGAGTLFVDGYGVRLDGSEAVIAGSELSVNGSSVTGGPIIVMRGSHAEVVDSEMVDNPLDGPFSVLNSSLHITGCRIANNGLGPQAIGNSRTRVTGSTVDNSGSDFTYGNSSLAYARTAITNNFTSWVGNNSELTYFLSTVQTLYVVAETSSSVELRGSTARGWCPFECPPGSEGSVSLQVIHHSFARASRAYDHDSDVWVDSNVRGDVVLDTFSDGSFFTGEPIASFVDCAVRSRVVTNLPPAGGTSEFCE